MYYESVDKQVAIKEMDNHMFDLHRFKCRQMPYALLSVLFITRAHFTLLASSFLHFKTVRFPDILYKYVLDRFAVLLGIVDAQSWRNRLTTRTLRSVLRTARTHFAIHDLNFSAF